ncbi:methyl-accepting chemotaxis sensory transducer [Moraxella macacae 0408225]|uniref:Methyl-accepting chemotaxis sensory transducer n=1 Tax=Moraxella macacae 0408225 TaxID=1230338 RepID=L2FA21_9GAMM|nr:methyl-accepting chemotaxis protein [Moraxella macacae]ELA09745.1 methyl-accepting chemotaxis sensory transducer [Moraxella macacae 0408225]
MDTQTSSVNTNTTSPVVVSSEKFVNNAGTQASKKWTTLAVVVTIMAILAFIYLVYSLLGNQGSMPVTTNVGAIGQGITTSIDDTLKAKDINGVKSGIANLDKNANEMNTVVTANPNLVAGWPENQKRIDFLLQNQEAIAKFHKGMGGIAKSLPEIQTQYRQLVEKMLVTGATTNQVAIANNQVWLAEKINHQINLLQSNQTTDIKALIQDLQQFDATIKAELSGTPEIQKVFNPTQLETLHSIKQSFDGSVKSALQQLVANEDIYSQAREQINAIIKFANANNQVISRSGIASNHNPMLYWVLALTALVGFLLALYFMYRQLQAKGEEERRIGERETLRQRHEMEAESERARKIQEENERNQMAILRLLDELGDLAEGDLTVNATVSEDFTGAIADSVNFAIDQLRQLVSAINVTADRVARASEQTQATAVELAEASESQVEEIAGASAAINEMAVSIDQVSSNAAESASVADRSVAIAYNGAEVVQRSIDGMNTIRDQIQETSKRIKRLGESSQEIGDIVGLINDIADQTNILALNAAIQASMAGEAGRGFAVVADEVQRLAERSATATKQIETLVKTIQADTNEAVMSMESTTAEVVKGAKLAKDAGEALEEVQSVSNNLAELIQSISNAAKQQAASAGHISNTMNIIQDITSQTTSGTLAAARSIGQLNEMAAALQESVSGFKLPDEAFTIN